MMISLMFHLQFLFTLEKKNLLRPVGAGNKHKKYFVVRRIRQEDNEWWGVAMALVRAVALGVV